MISALETYRDRGLPIAIAPGPLKRVEREQFRFPRSKKRRIRKKWTRDPRNWRSVEVDVAYMICGRLVLGPNVAARLGGS